MKPIVLAVFLVFGFTANTWANTPDLDDPAINYVTRCQDAYDMVSKALAGHKYSAASIKRATRTTHTCANELNGFAAGYAATVDWYSHVFSGAKNNSSAVREQKTLFNVCWGKESMTPVNLLMWLKQAIKTYPHIAKQPAFSVLVGAVAKHQKCK